MKNLHATAKLKLTKTVVTRYTKLQSGPAFLSTTDIKTATTLTWV